MVGMIALVHVPKYLSHKLGVLNKPEELEISSKDFVDALKTPQKILLWSKPSIGIAKLCLVLSRCETARGSL